ncbi:IS5 family transposase [Nitrospirillum viridazoti]|uniref:IS5/IS1182 family transposase n=1 Tax=Nitrospirillum viridazoti CBAmc TaxID=1441467 RepID=A0A248K274_9PROT|nr:IS5/IS1182 family transposase [Nitrospirillum amazonense CBAmc]TWB26163.1 IS5 family transposase [Nitrospirillum amazonense]
MIQFTFPPRYADGPTARYVTHMFDRRCQENGIERRLTKIRHPWTNGQVERMNRTIKEATVKRYNYDSHEQFEQHLNALVGAYNFAMPFDRSSMSRWRQRLGEERLAALIQESLRVAQATGALSTKDLARVAVDTTVQPKAIAHPTDARLTHKAIEKLVAFAKDNGITLRQSYLRVAKKAAIMVGRYTHAHQHKQANRQLKFLRTRLGRLIRDINRKIAAKGGVKAPALLARYAPLCDLAIKISMQTQRQRGQKVYSLHAPEVECIGKGKARAPYEFGCKVSVAVPITKPKGGLFVLHAQAIHGNPFDGHTLAKAVADIKANTGRDPDRVHVDKGYRGHNHPNKFKVWITGQVRRTTAAIKREMKRRAAIEPIIGHLKAEHRMGRNYLKGRSGDRINAVLAAAGFNFHLLIRWFKDLWRALFQLLQTQSKMALISSN